MKILTLKIRILVLWIFMAASVTAGGILFLWDKGSIEKVMSGEMAFGTGMLILMVSLWLIPFVLAFLTVNLRDKANRLTNIVLGAIFVAFNISNVIMRAAEQELPPFLIILMLSTIAAAALILWYAIRWPKYEE
jgi:hypothetical protein